jgi:hypothetical protein
MLLGCKIPHGLDVPKWKATGGRRCTFASGTNVTLGTNQLSHEENRSFSSAIVKPEFKH